MDGVAWLKLVRDHLNLNRKTINALGENNPIIAASRD